MTNTMFGMNTTSRNNSATTVKPASNNGQFDIFGITSQSAPPTQRNNVNIMNNTSRRNHNRNKNQSKNGSTVAAAAAATPNIFNAGNTFESVTSPPQGPTGMVTQPGSQPQQQQSYTNMIGNYGAKAGQSVLDTFGDMFAAPAAPAASPAASNTTPNSAASYSAAYPTNGGIQQQQPQQRGQAAPAIATHNDLMQQFSGML
jgi:hypothetical protein